MKARYPPGKLPAPALRALLGRYARPGDGLWVGPGVGFDAAAVESDGSWVAAAADPVTFTAESIGRHVVYVNANDVACLGARPRWFLATVLLPEDGADPELAESIFRDLEAACREVGAGLCGGHTEITPGLPRPIVSGAMLGSPVTGAPVTPRDIRPGDLLIATKGIAIEGTAILARDFRDRLVGKVAPAVLERARDLLRDPGILVVRDALAAIEAGGVHGLHDPTEGGLAQGVHEMAEAAGVGFRIDGAAIPVLEETRAVCRALGLDPLGLIASGTLLIAAAPESADGILAALQREGLPATVIGAAVPAAQGVTLGSGEAWPVFARDELARLLESKPPYRLLYDGDCAFCRGWADWIERRDPRDRIELVPFQEVDAREWGLRRADLESAMYLVGPNGQLWRGAVAARDILAQLPGWRWASWALRWPGALPVAERVYDWVARRRHRLSCGSPYCRRGEKEGPRVRTERDT